MTHGRGRGRGEKREGKGSANGRRRRAVAGVLALVGIAALAGAPGLHAGTLPPAPRAAPTRAGAAELIEREVAARLGGVRRGERASRPAVRDSLEASEAEYQGWKMFHVYCYRCHGTDALGSDLAPNLRHSVSPQGSVTHDVFLTTVKEGRVPKGMPTWKTVLSDEQIETLYAYVKARSEQRLAAGRPHRKPGS